MEPHTRAAKIKDLCHLQPDIDIISPICRWLQSNRAEDGTSHTLRSRWQYRAETIPQEFSSLDIWQSFRISVPRYNHWYEEEYATVTCKPKRSHQPAKFSPVFVLTYPTKEGIHSEP
jgi:hypothetical protein